MFLLLPFIRKTSTLIEKEISSFITNLDVKVKFLLIKDTHSLKSLSLRIDIVRIYLAILAKLLKLQRFDSISYLPSVRESLKRRKISIAKALNHVTQSIKQKLSK